MSDHESPLRAVPSPFAPGPEVPEEVEKALSVYENAEIAFQVARSVSRKWTTQRHSVEARTALLAAISRALADAREGALREALAMLDRVVFTHVSGLERLKLTDVARDEWIVRTTARKVLGLVSEQVRALASPPPAHEEGGR